MLQTYYGALSSMLRRLGSDPERVFSYADFRKELQKFGIYGVLIAPVMIQVVTADPMAVPDEEDSASADEKREPTMFISEKTIDAFNERIGDVLRDAERYGFL